MKIPQTPKDFVKDILELLERNTYQGFEKEYLYAMYLELVSKEKFPQPKFKVGEYVYVHTKNLGYGYSEENSQKKDLIFFIDNAPYVMGIITDFSIYNRRSYEVKTYFADNRDPEKESDIKRFTESELIKMSEYCKNPLLEKD
jgi:hypothetical protein